MDATTVNLILGIVAPVISALIAWGVAILNRKTGIEVSAKHQASLQSAFLNGARLALNRNLTGKAALDLVLDYAKKSVPDALDYFKPPVAVLEGLANAKIEQAKTEATDKLAELLRNAGVAARDVIR